MVLASLGVGSSGFRVTCPASMACLSKTVVKALTDRPRELANSATSFLVLVSVLMLSTVLAIMFTLYYFCMILQIYLALLMRIN